MINRFEYIDMEIVDMSTGETVKRIRATDLDQRNNFEDEYYRLEQNNPDLKLSKEPVVECECGKHLVCLRFTNTCSCGADYNSSGQRLAPRSQWGEETGEHWMDCY